MQDRKSSWLESDNPDKAAVAVGSRVAAWIVAAVIFVGALSAGIWFFQVRASDTVGRGDAERAKNAGANRTAAQERFESMYQDILSSDQRLDILKAAADKDPTDRIAATTYTGAVTYCIDVRADYNAEARKYSAKDFRDVDLPEQIDPNDPTTDCAPTKKETPAS